ncbi:MAG TPA: class I SAM-dependent methyltransferase [Kiritimatiellia bacterium]|nr:class I SAM-dependent methyltransferase [Kiritimatiellia bacterium]
MTVTTGKTKRVLAANAENYRKMYSRGAAFLQYPADWVVRFHNMYLKTNLPRGRALDFGCGAGNNSCFLAEKGYEVSGVDVSSEALRLVRKNLAMKHLHKSLIKRFRVIDPGTTCLPFPDDYFDFILSNQVLYYLPTSKDIHSTNRELARCLKPGGIVFFTMMGPKNYYIREHVKKVVGKRLCDVRIEDRAHRLYGVHEMIYLVKTRKELVSLFSEFECLSVGYFDQAMFDMHSNFHWIFIGRKRS